MADEIVDSPARLRVPESYYAPDIQVRRGEAGWLMVNRKKPFSIAVEEYLLEAFGVVRLAYRGAGPPIGRVP